MTAAEVKEALRKRHPAHSQGMVGEWTTLSEWCDIDLLAISAWSKQRVVGYEVKVSRSDYRRELLTPDKRKTAVEGCHEFYFATPAALLTEEEKAWEEPVWEPKDFERIACPGLPPVGGTRGTSHVGLPDRYLRSYPGLCSSRYHGGARGNTVEVPVPRVLTGKPDYMKNDETFARQAHWQEREDIVCPTCGGKGHLRKSIVERHAPTLWIPKDVGLVEITGRGCKVVKRAPYKVPDKPVIPKGAAKLVRYASTHPDPRHAR